jgi:hypothetical protein
MPCVVLDADDFVQIGADPRATFPLELLNSDNPPTMGHYTQGRASEVRLRRVEGRATITWTIDYVREEGA